MICRILDDETYIGNMVLGQTRVECVGGKAIRANREDYVIVENTHEAIADRKLFYRVRPRRISRERMQNAFLMDYYDAPGVDMSLKSTVHIPTQ